MRNEIRSSYLSLAGSFLQPSRGVHILNGHFCGAQDSMIFSKNLMRLRQKVEFLNISDACELVTSGGASSFDGVGVAFTFDDGFQDCFDYIAPCLFEYGVSACFFINPGFVDGDADYADVFTNKVVCTPGKKSMSWSQVMALCDLGHEIGNHTFDHLKLVSLPRDVLQKQVVESKVYLESRLDRQIDYFAWPYGKMHDVDQDALRVALSSHRYVFSGADHKKYLSFSKSVINRRHFEPGWQYAHLNYFLSQRRRYF